MGNWFIVYGMIKNAPHFLLLSYLSAEFYIRIVYDSIYLQLKNKRNQYESNESVSAKFYVTKLFSRPSYYHKSEYSHFPTIIICAFTVASIFVYYLSCTLIFVYIARTTSHASFITYTIERIFNIGIYSELYGVFFRN